jgi:hypothetical protein
VPPKAGHLIGGPGTGKAHATTLLQHLDIFALGIVIIVIPMEMYICMMFMMIISIMII